MDESQWNSGECWKDVEGLETRMSEFQSNTMTVMLYIDMRDCSAEMLQQYGEMAILVKQFIGTGSIGSNLHEIVGMFCRVWTVSCIVFMNSVFM